MSRQCSQRHLFLAVSVIYALSLSVYAQDEDFVPLTCVSCAAGQYLDQDSLNCTACPAGSSSFEYTNASSALDCLCQPGFENASTACVECTLGFYKETLQNTTCHECPSNAYTDSTGSSSVAACVCNAGYYPTGEDFYFQDCLPCNAGTYKSDLADAVCLTCPSDHYCPEGAPAVLPCPAGTYNPSPGLNSAAGCAACPAGTSCPVGSAEALECAPGTVRA